MSRVLILWGLSLFPMTVFASVTINEVAWMGTASSGANEWIELRNDGVSAVDLSLWQLESQDKSLQLKLSGSISPDGYYLIERTDDNSAENTPGDLITSFGSGLSNSGETLKLFDAAGTVIDQVVGGRNWSTIGGNNKTKETAQRTSTGWVTAMPTPRAANALTEVKQDTVALQQSRTIAPANIVELRQHRSQKPKPTIGIQPIPVSESPKEQVAAVAESPKILWSNKGETSNTTSPWVYGSIGVVLLTLAAAMIVKSEDDANYEAEQYAIIEDIIEEA